jgi:[acyl-carrier-protein] S-malonyltransferase
MTSLMGASEEVAEELAAIGAEHGICTVANHLAPGQIVLSGELAALDAAEKAAPDKGVRRAVRLTVAGGFHSECMRPASERLGRALEEVDIRRARIPVVSNVTGAPVEDPDEIRDLLARQVCSPVLWAKGMRWALEQASLGSFLEPGPGTVLAGLLKRTSKTLGIAATCRSAATPDDV